MGDLLGRCIWDVVPASPRRIPFQEAVERAQRDRVPAEVEAFHGGRGLWFDVRVYPYAEGVVVFFRDVTERRTRLARDRYLTEASRLLSTSLDYEATLRRVAQLAVPEVADWCAVLLVSDEGEFERTAVAHADPAKVALVEQLNERYPPDPRAPGGSGQVVRTGEPIVLTEISDEMLVALAKDETHLAAIRALGMQSGMVVPMRAPDRIIGAITFVISEGSQRFTTADLPFAEELAARAALAVENARLYEKARQAEERLRAANGALEQRVKARTAELARANEQLSIRNRELQDFAYVASHDLQEPLRKIRTFVELIQMDGAPLGEPRAGYLARMDASVERMSRLISDLLAFSRVATDVQATTRVDLNETLAHVAASLEARLDETGGRIDVPARLPAVEADPTQMQQLFQNLIGNALKFHREGTPPVVRVTCDVDGQAARIVVADNGIGFEDRHAERIFAPFQRLHARHEYEGTGMGLAIVRRIVERHRWDIAVESTPGTGTRFIITARTASGAAEAAPGGEGA